ncbi:1-acyl-sn-glycerol-3-phosphate-acyltransferase, partial [Pterulicium gracile]
MSLLSLVVKPLAYISLPVILLRSLASISPTCRYYIRLYVYMSTMATAGVVGSFLAAGMAMVGEKYNVQYVVGRMFYNVAGRLMGIDVVIEGEEYLDVQPAVLMCNHQSVLDILTVGRIYPKRTTIVSKKSIQYTPLGPFMSMSGAVFINRGNNASALRSLAAAGETVKSQRLSLWVYPEGTRRSGEDDALLPFKKGAFHLAVQGGLPIIPIVTENYWRIYHKGIFGGGTIKVRVLPPVSTTGLTSADVAELANTVRDQMLKSLREI